MIFDWIASNGGWAWLTAGLVLLGLEVLAPGVFLMWIGLAAAAVGTITLIGLSDFWWGWQAQTLVFVALSALFAVAGQRTLGRRLESPDAASRFNRAGERMVGRSGTLVEPIEGGIGRAKLGETVWRVGGPDLPTGARVVVTGERDGTLLVKAARATVSA